MFNIPITVAENYLDQFFDVFIQRDLLGGSACCSELVFLEYIVLCINRARQIIIMMLYRTLDV